MGSYVFRWPHPANDVHVTGTFDDWAKSEQLRKVGDVWEKEVNLPSADDKILYKFVVDDQWITDHEAPQEDDGHYNVNNVLYPHEIKKHEPAAADESQKPAAVEESQQSPTAEKSYEPSAAEGVAGGVGAAAFGAAALSSAAPESTTSKMAGEVPLEQEPLERRMSPPGAFPESPSYEPESFAVDPIPATDSMKNPVDVPAGEKIPEPDSLTSNTVESTATTSKEGYEKDASAPFPPTEAEEPAEYGVKPIPATSSIGNPVNLPAGEKVPDSRAFTSNTVDSTATTSKEGYEHAGEAAAGLFGGAALGAGVASAFRRPVEENKNIIPESSLPMGAEATDTLDAGPTIQSASPDSTTAQLAGAVPLEKKRQGMVIDPEDAPITESETAPSVPDTVAQSLREAHQEPEAAASAEAVKEKSAVESELLQKTTSSEATGESAAAAKMQTSYYGLATAVPTLVEKSMAEAQASPEAAVDSSAVAEKSAMEKELLHTVPSAEDGGEPAPTIAAATSTTAPAPTSASSDKLPGTSTVAAAALSDGTDRSVIPSSALRSSVPVEKTEGDATEYAPPMEGTSSPGVSRSAAAALSDGTEDPALADEPAVRMMRQQESETTRAEAPIAEEVPMVATNNDYHQHPSAYELTTMAATSDSKVDRPVPASLPQTSTGTDNEIPSTQEVRPTEDVPATEHLPNAEETPATGEHPAQETIPEVASSEQKSAVPLAQGVPSMASTATMPTATDGATDITKENVPEAKKEALPEIKKETAPETSKPSETRDVSPGMAEPRQKTVGGAAAATTSTSTKPTASTGSSAAASSAAAKERKKKNRLSGFFKKIFD